MQRLYNILLLFSVKGKVYQDKKESRFLIFLYISTEYFTVSIACDIVFFLRYVKIIVFYDIFNRGINIKKSQIMKMETLKFFLIILFINISIPGFSQEPDTSFYNVTIIIDSLRKSGMILKEPQEIPEIVLSYDKAIKYLQKRYRSQYWKESQDPLRRAIERLIFEASNQPYDSSEYFLKEYPFDSINIPWEKFYRWKPMIIKVPVISAKIPDDSLKVQTDSLQVKADTLQIPADLLQASDTAGQTIVSDTMFIENQLKKEPVVRDTTVYFISDTFRIVGSRRSGFPFVYYNNPYEGDSLRVAVEALMDYLQARDSSIINITGSRGAVSQIWLNSRTGMMKRYWLRNEMDDSITVWIGSPSRNTVGLYLEQGVNIRRPTRQQFYKDARIEVEEVDKSTLLDVGNIVVRKRYWKYRTETSFSLTQASLTNWVKGGESSISSSLDITGYADYDNKPLKMTSANFARLKFGLIATEENGVRKNIDLLETNSKLNHKAFGKFDFSGILLFKTQIAKGYTYSTNDTTVVSKFFNPATLTTGFGLDYKPNKNTSINFSPLSYKGTFVPDTAAIDQTKYGIAEDKRSKHEPGMSFMVTNKFTPVKTITITNRLQLFTNYINNPQNVDIDWEMIVTANLNWFTDVRLNTHFIYDDDTKTPVFDKEKQPVLGPDGKQKKTARAQFKELLGFSFVFRF